MKFEEWKTKLSSTDRSDRYDAADCMPDADPEKIIPLLIQALDDEDEMVRVAVLETLGFLPDKRVRQALRGHYEKETDPLAKEFALESLGKIGGIDDFITILSIVKQAEGLKSRWAGISSFLGVQQGMSYHITPKIIEILEKEEARGEATANVLKESLEAFIKSLKEVEPALRARRDLDKEKGWNIEDLEKVIVFIHQLLKGLPEDEIKKE